MPQNNYPSWFQIQNDKCQIKRLLCTPTVHLHFLFLSDASLAARPTHFPVMAPKQMQMFTVIPQFTSKCRGSCSNEVQRPRSGCGAFADVATLVLFAAVLPQLVAGIEALVAESILVCPTHQT
jgi:hypothetical protein